MAKDSIENYPNRVPVSDKNHKVICQQSLNQDKPVYKVVDALLSDAIERDLAANRAMLKKGRKMPGR